MCEIAWTNNRGRQDNAENGEQNLNRANQGEAKVKGESSKMLYYFALYKKSHYIELVFSYKFILTTYGYTLYGEL